MLVQVQPDAKRPVQTRNEPCKRCTFKVSTGADSLGASGKLEGGGRGRACIGGCLLTQRRYFALSRCTQREVRCAYVRGSHAVSRLEQIKVSRRGL
jgi:hypothetical protein